MKNKLQELKIYGIVLNEFVKSKYLELMELATLVLALIFMISDSPIRADIFFVASLIIAAINYTKKKIIAETINSREYILDYMELTVGKPIRAL